MINFFWTQIKKRERIVRYIIAGGMATGVSLILLYGLTEWLGLWYLLAATWAFIGGFFVSFFLQKLWAFQDNSRAKTRRQMTIFLLIALTNLINNALLMYVLVDIFKVWYLLAQAIVLALIAFWTYNALRIFVFKPMPAINE